MIEPENCRHTIAVKDHTEQAQDEIPMAPL